MSATPPPSERAASGGPADGVGHRVRGGPIGDLYARLDDATAIATVTAALDHGVTLVDTSPLYGHGLSEHRCGTALRRVPRESFVLSTKVGRVTEPRAPRQDGLGLCGRLPARAAVRLFL